MTVQIIHKEYVNMMMIMFCLIGIIYLFILNCIITVELIQVYLYKIFFQYQKNKTNKRKCFSVHFSVEVFCYRLEMSVSKQFIITELPRYSNNNVFFYSLIVHVFVFYNTNAVVSMANHHCRCRECF